MIHEQRFGIHNQIEIGVPITTQDQDHHWNSGLGEIKVQGLRAEGEHWVNDAYGTSKVQLRLDIQGGVGAINLIAE